MTSAIRTIAVAVLVGLTAPQFGGQAIPAGRVSTPTYTIIDLGTLCGTTSVAVGINENGQVVGAGDSIKVGSAPFAGSLALLQYVQ